MADVNTHHPDYDDAAPQWQKCRAAVAGEDAVKKAGEVFLPKLTDQSPAEYAAYVARAVFYNATGRTVDGLSGLVFRRPPTIDLPAQVAFLSDDADTAGTPMLGFCERVVDELLQAGRIGILADYPRMDGALTLADQKAANGRPYLKTYCAESILNWRTERVNNRTMLSLVVLSEQFEEPSPDGWTVTCIPQCRVLKLVAGTANPDGTTRYTYTVEIWRLIKQEDGKEKWILIETTTPIMGGHTLDYIPFLIAGPMGVDPAVAKSPILDLANINLSHFRNSADYEHGLHFTGLPTPVVTGHQFEVGTDGQQQKFMLGSSQIQAFPNPQAKVFFLEFAGEGLTALSKRLEEKENMMAALGARLLAAQKRAAETAETAAIHRSGENGVLASLALAASDAIEKAAAWCAEWEGANPDSVEIALNTDYLPTGLNAQELTALVQAWQAGAISHLTLLDNLERGEIARQGVDSQQELADIEAEGPKLGAVPMGGGGGGSGPGDGATSFG
jgi:hypothetical protein